MRSLRLSLVAVLLAAAVFAACGDDDTTGEPPAGTAGDPASSSLVVGATDQLKFDADSYEAEAGTIEVAYVNEGSVAHTLLVKDIDDFKLGVTGSGDRDEGTVELEPGEYTLYCDVAGHEAAGMVADLTVS